MNPIRVLIVDDHDVVRSGLGMILAVEKDIEVVGAARDGEEGLEMVGDLAPHVAVVDYQLPKMSGVELCEEIVKRHPEIPVVMLTTYLDDTVVRGAMDAGAKGYVCKDIEATELVSAIRSASKGHSPLDPKVAGRMMKWAQGKISRSGELSEREIQVLRLVAKGSSSSEAAEALGVGLPTVKTYIRRAMVKLDCRTRSQAAAVAARRGLL